ncbi:MAG: glycosyltransferase family 4 protein [Lachnospiraceae bacterium]|nr:glycosyltransferase family 4 protein [Lachnospiraceae bacterium]
MRIIVFGIGKIFHNNIHRILKYAEIVRLTDNKAEKIGTTYMGFEVIAPDHICDYRFDIVVISTKKYEVEIRKQLCEMGIGENRVISVGDFPAKMFGFKSIQVYQRLKPDKECERKALLLSHDLSRTGAPIALLGMAKVLNELGFGVFVWAIGSDDALTDYLQADISVCIFDSLDLSDEMKNEMMKYDILIVNTAVLHYVISGLPVGIPCLWWIHEEYDGYPFIPDGFVVPPNVHISGVSNRCRNSIEKHLGIECDVLPLYVEQTSENQNEKIKTDNIKRNGVIRFLTIGYGYRKGIDILLSAIEKNSEKWLDKAEFLIVGKGGEDYQIPHGVIDLGYKDQAQIREIYSESDVVICPSRFETLSIAVVQGWANRKPCIVSDTVGAAEYIEQGKNGLIFRSENPSALSDSIQWIIDNKSSIDSMGKEAYSTYAKCFAKDTFKEKLDRLINRILGDREL